MGRESPRRFKIIQIIPSRREYVIYNPQKAGRHTSFSQASPQNTPPVQILPTVSQAPMPQIVSIASISLPQQNSQTFLPNSQPPDQENDIFDNFVANDQEEYSFCDTGAEEFLFKFTEEF